MGIIDDYYGGYESLALFTDEDGVVDFEAAYDAQLPDDDGYYDINMDPFERAIDYNINQALRENALPGWSDTGRRTMAGKPIWEGSCSSCNKPTTVPFVPLAGGSPPQCRQCHAQSKAGRGGHRGRGSGRGGASSSRTGRGGGGSSSRAGGTGRSAEAEHGRGTVGVGAQQRDDQQQQQL